MTVRNWFLFFGFADVCRCSGGERFISVQLWVSRLTILCMLLSASTASTGADLGTFDPVVSAAFEIDQPVSVSRPPGHQTYPAIASNGDTFLVAWRDAEGIRARRFSRNGLPLDAISRIIAGGTPGERPAVASDGMDYVVLQRKNGELALIRITAEGDLLPSASTGIKNSFSPAIAFNGETFLAVWFYPTAGIVGVRLDRHGRVLDRPFALSRSAAARNPVVASNNHSQKCCDSKVAVDCQQSIAFE